MRCPFPSQMNPHLSTAEQHAIGWALAHELVSGAALARLTKVGVGSLVAQAYPQARPQALLTCAEWLTWLFVYDDLCDEPSACADAEALRVRLLAILDGLAPTATDPPMVRALADVYARVSDMGGPACAFRIGKLMELHILTTRWQADNRAAGRVPDLQSYRTLRRHTGAVYTCFELIDLAASLSLPETVREEEIVLNLTDLANDAISWCNDLVSIGKEDGDGHNLVVVLERELRISREAALLRAVAMHDAVIGEFVALSAQLPSFGASADAELRRYVMGLGACIRGNYDWSLRTRRYQPPVTMIQPALRVGVPSTQRPAAAWCTDLEELRKAG